MPGQTGGAFDAYFMAAIQGGLSSRPDLTQNPSDAIIQTFVANCAKIAIQACLIRNQTQASTANAPTQG